MSSSAITHDDYEKLCDELWEHNRLYYVEHAPRISDEAYDRLFKQLEEIEKRHPEWVTSWISNSARQRNDLDRV